jgi:anti-sigma regulatory factor (Ser/Thr protein kinase)
LLKIDLQNNPLLIQENESTYVMFLPPNMACLKDFRRAIKNSLNEKGFLLEEIVQIELACDEAVTNSISANIENKSTESLICKWSIKDNSFSLTLLDYGPGIPLEKLNKTPFNTNSFQKLIENLSHSENPKILPFGNKNKIHRNLGQGLNIIKNLMDSVKVLYHCNGKITESLEDKPNGSILKMNFCSKNH